jgi:hypothetical protein
VSVADYLTSSGKHAWLEIEALAGLFLLIFCFQHSWREIYSQVAALQ